MAYKKVTILKLEDMKDRIDGFLKGMSIHTLQELLNVLDKRIIEITVLEDLAK